MNESRKEENNGAAAKLLASFQHYWAREHSNEDFFVLGTSVQSLLDSMTTLSGVNRGVSSSQNMQTTCASIWVFEYT